MTVIDNIVKNINEAFDIDKSFFRESALPKDFVKAHTTDAELLKKYVVK